MKRGSEFFSKVTSILPILLETIEVDCMLVNSNNYRWREITTCNLLLNQFPFKEKAIIVDTIINKQKYQPLLFCL